MAREHARFSLLIWEDDDYRDLSIDAQHLYQLLMIHPQLSYAGVTDWRPGKLAGFTRGWTSEDVLLAAKELSEQRYIVIDESTEEVVIRSFIRNDGLLDSPNMAVAVRKAHMAISSATLRGVIVHELNRLRSDKPDLKGWKGIGDLLDKTSVDPSSIPSFTPSAKVSGNPSVTVSASPTPIPSGNPSVGISPTTAPAPTPAPSSLQETSSLSERTVPRKRATRLPDDWKPTQEDVAWQRDKGVSDLDARRELEKFANYWQAKSGKDATKLDWSKTWRNWLLNGIDRKPQRPVRDDDDPLGWAR